MCKYKVFLVYTTDILAMKRSYPPLLLPHKLDIYPFRYKTQQNLIEKNICVYTHT